MPATDFSTALEMTTNLLSRSTTVSVSGQDQLGVPANTKPEQCITALPTSNFLPDSREGGRRPDGVSRLAASTQQKPIARFMHFQLGCMTAQLRY
jgi:hypothetical protein